MTLTPALRRIAFLQVALATVLGFAATDLVLPAIPLLPAALHGTAAQAQYVLAAYTGGFAAGLLLFGELGARWPQRPLLVGALWLFALASAGAGLATSMAQLIALRFLQGVAASAGATFAPGIIRRLFDRPEAMRAIGLQGSIESLMPALAPIGGAWLLSAGGWSLSFFVLAAVAAPVALAVAPLPAAAFPPRGEGRQGSYLALLRNRELARHGLSQAFSLAGLLVIVLGAPAVMVNAWGGTLGDFVRMQCVGVACFIGAVQLSHGCARRWGEHRVIAAGSLLSAAGVAAILGYALAGGRSPVVVTVLWVAVNGGFGLRGPAGFLRAIQAAGGDDSRAAALVILAILASTAAGTVVAAPWITLGLVPVALVAFAFSAASPLLLWVLRPTAGRAAGAR